MTFPLPPRVLPTIEIRLGSPLIDKFTSKKKKAEHNITSQQAIKITTEGKKPQMR
jgi:hypothetical protein